MSRLKKESPFAHNTPYVGRVDHVSSHHAFIVVQGLAQDIFVSHSRLAGAMHEDTVRVALLPKADGTRREGKVLSIITRARKTLIGRVERQGKRLVVIPSHKRLQYPVLLQIRGSDNVRPDDKIIVTLESYPTSRSYPTGTVCEILGPSSS